MFNYSNAERGVWLWNQEEDEEEVEDVLELHVGDEVRCRVTSLQFTRVVDGEGGGRLATTTTTDSTTHSPSDSNLLPPPPLRRRSSSIDLAHQDPPGPFRVMAAMDGTGLGPVGWWKPDQMKMEEESGDGGGEEECKG